MKNLEFLEIASLACNDENSRIPSKNTPTPKPTDAKQKNTQKSAIISANQRQNMSKKDEVKVKIQYLMIYLGVVLTSFVAVIGWGYANFSSLSTSSVLTVGVCAAGLLVAVFVVQMKINKNADEIRRLK